MEVITNPNEFQGGRGSRIPDLKKGQETVPNEETT